MTHSQYHRIRSIKSNYESSSSSSSLPQTNTFYFTFSSNSSTTTNDKHIITTYIPSSTITRRKYNNFCLECKPDKPLLSHHLNNNQHFADRKTTTTSIFGCFISDVLPAARRRRYWKSLKLIFRAVSLMACPADHLAAHVPIDMTKTKFNGQQKKEELEQEVGVLRKMLDHEQKVHEFLERLQQQQEFSTLSIPNFLPPKMKELLTELAMVENEITRLESQISQIQSHLKHEKEAKSKQWHQHGIQKNRRENSSQLPPISPMNNNNSSSKGGSTSSENKKVTFETKTLHFISKAIKGDYNLNDFRVNDKAMGSKRFSDQKENSIHEGVGVFREKVLKRSGVLNLKPASPLREPRHPTPRRDRNLEVSDFPTKFLSTPLHYTEEDPTINKWAPNKLSENIMKCLVYIFVRLLRTSKAVELEKSGPIARSTEFSLSFRAETGSNSKSNLSMFQKDSRQQDPYGVFDVGESVPRDIGPYKNLVRFTSGSMDPKCISSSNSVPLFQKLKVLMNGLEKVDLRFLTHQQKLAFWINMYNACIMHGFLQYGVPSSPGPEKLLALLNKATLNIGGNVINAQAIEFLILRKSVPLLAKGMIGKAEKDNKEAIIRDLYGLEKLEPNVTFALCCGTRSSPAVKIYTADGVISELERSKVEYLQASIVVKSTKRIVVPELLVEYMQDFAKDMDSLIEWICQHLPTSGTLRKSIVDCFRGLPHGAKTSSGIVEKMPYDFEFQYLLAV